MAARLVRFLLGIMALAKNLGKVCGELFQLFAHPAHERFLPFDAGQNFLNSCGQLAWTLPFVHSWLQSPRHSRHNSWLADRGKDRRAHDTGKDLANLIATWRSYLRSLARRFPA